MNQPLVDKIVRAVLYEGYILYPYRPSVKTQQRWTFGGVFPAAFAEAQVGSDACAMQTQCLFRPADAAATISLTVRFLHLTQRTVEVADGETFRAVPSLQVGDRSLQTWQEAVERQIDLDAVQLTDFSSQQRRFVFPHTRTVETLTDADGTIVGRLVRDQEQISGTIEFSAESKRDGVFQLSARVLNDTPIDAHVSRDTAVLKSFASTHLIITAPAGGLVSATDPPAELADLVAACSNVGCWPVLVGDAGATDTLLISPIILYDYPQVAPESPGDLFDGCEIDEILTLRIMTLTDDEKRQAIAVDPLAADMMARTEALARDQLMNLHGAIRAVQPTQTQGASHG